MIPITKQSTPLFYDFNVDLYNVKKFNIYWSTPYYYQHPNITEIEVNYLFNGAFTDISSVKLFSNGNNRATFDGDLLFNGNIRWDENDSYWGTDNETKKHDGYNSIVNNVSYHYFYFTVELRRPMRINNIRLYFDSGDYSNVKLKHLDPEFVDISGVEWYKQSNTTNTQTIWQMEEEIKRAGGRLLNESELAELLKSKNIQSDDYLMV